MNFRLFSNNQHVRLKIILAFFDTMWQIILRFKATKVTMTFESRTRNSSSVIKNEFVFFQKNPSRQWLRAEPNPKLRFRLVFHIILTLYHTQTESKLNFAIGFFLKTCYICPRIVKIAFLQNCSPHRTKFYSIYFWQKQLWHTILFILD